MFLRKQGKLWSFEETRNVLIKKTYGRIYFKALLDFKKLIRCIKKNRKVIYKQIRFHCEVNDKFLESECIFKLLCLCESCKESEICCKQEKSLKIFEQIVIFAYLPIILFYRNVFRTLRNLYAGAFSRKQLTVFRLKLF